ncbi:MAG TPA: sigma-54 dependent transcriptional regulator [Candidatus Methylomirabilis sp.]|nr:sigma-54 dependent transcriptional regulator [Candidatus Methylomirabilis sp.]
MTAPIRVLVADDEKNLRELLIRELGRKGHAVTGALDGRAALDQLAEEVPDVLLLDLKMPRVEGIEVLKALQQYPEAPQVIVMTGFQEVSTAVEAMKLGAYDYLTKPTPIEELDILIRKAAEKGRLIRQNVALRAQLDPAASGIITVSPAMEEVLSVVDRVAPTDSAVLILGESGTGKELVARALHQRSARAAQAFVPIHCGALPREVLESELFGHEKGAFTGAINAKPGLIELAEGGTLFLDEIGEMEPESQVKLLRVLESLSFFRVGGTRRRTVDLRLVAATNRDLVEAIKTNQFRQDLYYRINTITVSLPPLRERREDIRPLAEYFVEQHATYGRKKLSPASLQSLERYDWPGNVRELEHVIQRGAILCRGDEIQTEDLPPEVRGGRASTMPPGGSLEDMERQHIIATLKRVGGHRGKASALLGIDPKTLYRKILAYGIVPDQLGS